jgi:hypothetical protein
MPHLQRTSFLLHPSSGVLPFMTEKVHQLCRLVSSRLASDCPKLRTAEVRADRRLGTVLAEAAESLVFSMAYA